MTFQELANEAVEKELKQYMRHVKSLESVQDEVSELGALLSPLLDPIVEEGELTKWSVSLFTNWIIITVPWNFTLIDKIGLELQKIGYTMKEPDKREDDSLRMNFNFLANEKALVRVTIVASAEKANSSFQTCRVKVIGERRTERVEPLYKVVCDEEVF